MKLQKPKIKCPIPKCKTSQWLEFANSTGLFRHMMNEHNNHEVTSYIAIQTFKIHEKIELVEKLQEQRKQEFNEIDFTNDQIIKELKSLLEDKK